MEAIRPDCRRLHCGRCGRVVYVCSRCDRGQQYCGADCSDKARRASLSAAGARYQQTPRGRRNHARRQCEYRQRLAVRRNVTHQGCRLEPRAESVKTCATPPLSSVAAAISKGSTGSGRRLYRCTVCHELCEPWVRVDFLRRRRSEGASRVSIPRFAAGTRGRGDDLPRGPR